MIAGLYPHLIDHACVFGGLGALKAFLPGFKQRTGIGHGFIKPEPIEIIAKVIVMADVLFRLPLGIALEEMAQSLIDAHKRHAGKAVIDHVIVGVDEIHQGLKIGRIPPTIKVGVRKPKIALADQTGKAVGVFHHHLGHRAGVWPFGAKGAPIGQDIVKPTCVDLFRHLKDLRKIARQVGLAGGVGQDHALRPQCLLCIG